MPATSSAAKFLYPWQSQYEAAFLEVKPEKVPKRIHQARVAIFKRLQVISVSTGHVTEKQVLENALEGLRFLMGLFD
jgi:hypothetical protein